MRNGSCWPSQGLLGFSTSLSRWERKLSPTKDLGSQSQSGKGERAKERLEGPAGAASLRATLVTIMREKKRELGQDLSHPGRRKLSGGGGGCWYESQHSEGLAKWHLTPCSAGNTSSCQEPGTARDSQGRNVGNGTQGDNTFAEKERWDFGSEPKKDKVEKLLFMARDLQGFVVLKNWPGCLLFQVSGNLRPIFCLGCFGEGRKWAFVRSISPGHLAQSTSLL